MWKSSKDDGERGGQTALCARRARTLGRCPLDARSKGQIRPPLGAIDHVEQPYEIGDWLVLL